MNCDKLTLVAIYRERALDRPHRHLSALERSEIQRPGHIEVEVLALHASLNVIALVVRPAPLTPGR